MPGQVIINCSSLSLLPSLGPLWALLKGMSGPTLGLGRNRRNRDSGGGWALLAFTGIVAIQDHIPRFEGETPRTQLWLGACGHPRAACHLKWGFWKLPAKQLTWKAERVSPEQPWQKRPFNCSCTWAMVPSPSLIPKYQCLIQPSLYGFRKALLRYSQNTKLIHLSYTVQWLLYIHNYYNFRVPSPQKKTTSTLLFFYPVHSQFQTVTNRCFAIVDLNILEFHMNIYLILLF